MANRFQEALDEQQNRFQEALDAEGPMAAATQAGARTFFGNLLAAPRAAVERGIPFLAAGAEAGAAKMLGRPFAFRERYAAQQQQFPATLGRFIPSPTTQELEASIRSQPARFPGGEQFGEAYSRNLAEIQASEQEMAERHPFAVGMGEVAGDVGTLMAGRAPASKRMFDLEKALLSRQIPTRGSEVANVFIQAANTKAAKALLRGVVRAGETGLEAAALEVLKGDDPFAVAAFAAGGQAAGSMSLQLGKSIWTGGPLKGPWNFGIKAAIAAWSFATLYQIIKEAAPGGRDSWYQSVGEGYEHVAHVIGLGMAAGMVGGGRLRGAGQVNFPRLADAAAAIPRGIALSLLTRAVEAPKETQNRFEAALETIKKSPESEEGKRLGKALLNGTLLEEM